MLLDVVSAKYRGDYRIELVFENGARGIVDLSPFLARGGVFERFQDIRFFKDFRIDEELGTIVWKDGIDIAPETLYAWATGTPLPEWTEAEEPVALSASAGSEHTD